MSENLVDPEFELIDPCPDIRKLFIEYDRRFFDQSLGGCEVKWSPRMTTCAGVCSYEGRGGLCSIRLSKPLLKLRPRKDLVETLLHEMIHAYLFVTQRNTDRDGHGPAFQSHMHRINRAAGTRITIYHTFHAEVALYKQHWWRCNGPCRERRPFMGWVKRASNRAPGPNDRWWAQHQATCGGVYEKVKEPEGYGVKKEKKTKSKGIENVSPTKPTSLDKWISSSGKGAKVGTGAPKPKASGILGSSTGKPKADSKTNGDSTTTDIVPFLGSGQRLGGNSTSTSTGSSVGGGQRLGGPSRGVSRLLTDDLPVSREKRKTPTPTPTTSKPGPSSSRVPDVIVLDDLDDQPSPPKKSVVDTVDKSHSSVDAQIGPIVICPSCDEEVEEYYINDHLDYCVG